MLLGRSAMCNKVWQCEDGKVYVERVRGGERSFKHLTKGDMIVSPDGNAFPCFAIAAYNRCSSLSYSSISPRTSRGSGCILALWLCFRFRASLPCSSYSLPLHFSAILTSSWQWDRKRRYSAGNDQLTQVYTNRTLPTIHTFNCIPKARRKLRPHPANRERTLQD